MSDLNPTVPSLSISAVLNSMSRAVGQNAAAFFALSALLQGLPLAVIGFLQYQAIGPTMSQFSQLGSGAAPPAGTMPDMSGFFRFWLISMGAGLLSFVLQSVLQAALCHGVMSSLLGRRASFVDCLRTGVRFVLPAVLIGLVTGIACFIGLLCLIVPGVILALGWAVSVPVAVVEERGVFESIGRSWRLTDGYKGQIFLLALVYGVVVWIGSMAVGSASGSLGYSNIGLSMMIQLVIVAPMLTTLTAVLGTAGGAALYYELRSVKEGVGAEEMAQVFA
jgi:hypothetical protein